MKCFKFLISGIVLSRASVWKLIRPEFIFLSPDRLFGRNEVTSDHGSIIQTVNSSMVGQGEF